MMQISADALFCALLCNAFLQHFRQTAEAFYASAGKG